MKDSTTEERPGAPAIARVPVLLSPREMADLLGLTQSGFYALRRRGCGPPFVSVGGGRKPTLRYRLEDVQRWLEENTMRAKELK